MKSTLIMAVMLIITSQMVYGQMQTRYYPDVFVKRKSSSQRELKIKTHKRINIKMNDGRFINGKDYQFMNNMIIFNGKDSLALQDIDYIIARVFGDDTRKLVGWSLLGVGTGAFVFGWIKWSIEEWASGWEFSSPPLEEWVSALRPSPPPSVIGYISPGLLLAGSGALLLAPRKFDLDKWDIFVESQFVAGD
jgi:hypothetical protein